jgi:lysophospholipase L1-like esterase
MMTNTVFQPQNSFLFENGDRICFIGDSITHGNFYMGYIYEYYLTRFPERKINLINCGIAGDRAMQAALRLEYDVTVHSPNKAVVMFGANDIEMVLYSREVPTQEILKAREKALENFREGMEKIIQILMNKGVEIILAAAIPYDQTIKAESLNNYGCNDALANCAGIVKDLAKKYGCCIIDLYSPMNEINTKLQEINPYSTIIGPDRVHPGEEGTLLMAYFFLKQQGVLQEVVSAKIDFEKKEIFQNNCEVNNIIFEGLNVSFDYKPKSFPFYIDETFEAANKMVSETEEWGREMLSVKGFPTGEYELTLNGVSLGVYSHSSLDAGINIAVIPQSPRQKHSEKIHQANLLRHQWEQKLRTIRFVEYNPRNKRIDMTDAVLVKQFLEEDLESIKKESYYGYFREQTSLYYELKPCENEILIQIEKCRNNLYTINQLDTYRISICEVS